MMNVTMVTLKTQMTEPLVSFQVNESLFRVFWQSFKPYIFAGQISFVSNTHKQQTSKYLSHFIDAIIIYCYALPGAQKTINKS
jgi:hypothetical protein